MRLRGAASLSRLSDLTGGLTRRVLVAGTLVAALVAIVVVALADEARQQQHANAWAERSATVLQSSLLAERRAVDLETGIRGYAATGDRAFLAPWSAARAALPGQLSALRKLVSSDLLQERRATAIQDAVSTYITDYTAPFVARAQPLRGPALTQFTIQGKELLDALREKFARFDATELALQHAHERQASSADNRLLTLGAVAAALVLFALAAFVWFVAGAVTLPLRRGSSALGRLAAGERGVELRETGANEVQLLARSFNQAVRQLSQREHELEQTAAKLRDAAAYSESVLASVQEAHIGMDKDGLITSWNPAAERIFGWSKEEAIGAELAGLIMPEALQEAHRRGLYRYLQTGEARVLGLRLELTAVRRTGVEFPIELSVASVEHQGRPMFHAFISDISGRRAADRQLRVLADVVAFAHDAVITMDLGGGITSFNPGAERLFGYREREVLGESVLELHEPGPRREIAQGRVARLLSGEPVREHAVGRQRKDGTVVYVDLSACPVRNERGEVVGGATILRDISEQREAEANVRRLSRIVEQTEEAITSTASDGTITHWNLGAERLYGHTPAEAIGQPISIIVPPERAGEESLLLARVLAGERLQQHETIRVCKDGSWVDVSLTISPLDNGDGVAIGASTITRDISEQKRAQRERERALEELNEAQRVSDTGSWTWDPQSGEASWSDQMFRIFGRDPTLGPAVGDHFLAYVSPDDRQRVGRHYDARLSGGPKFEFDYMIRRGDGEKRVLHSVGHRDPLRAGSYMGVVQDVTEIRTAEQAQRAAEEQLRTIFEHAPIGHALLTLDGGIEQVNRAFAELCGRTRSELPGLRCAALLHPGDVAVFQQATSALIDGRKEQLSLELRFMSGTGAPLDVAVHGTLLRGADGQPTHILCQCHDVSERKQFEAQLQFMADHDPLTGLLNRRKFEAELDRHVAEVKRYGPAGALIVLDIDYFKHVNDALGHNAGDELIVSMAGVLRSRLRESDVLARLGGDEFAVLLPHADGNDARRVAQALVEAVRSSTTLLGGEYRHVTTSAGVALFEPRSEDISGEAVLVDADLAMYDAKEAGRDRYATYSSSEHRVSRTKARLTWVRRIEQALEQERFVLVAQPILDLHAGVVRQHELLIRMLDEQGDLIHPTSFLYIAERFGLIGRIDEWVSGQAIGLIERHPELTLEVNISGHSLGNEALLETIQKRIRASSIDPSKLIFEVTETAAVANVAEARAFAQRLRDLGCRFALDDFGAGFGSFYYLKHLPFDYIKIDGEFVRHAAGGRIDQLVIEAVVRIARGLGKETIAEFVTDAQTMRMVKRLGVDHAQGYHVGEPAPLADLTRAASAAADYSSAGAPTAWNPPST